MSLERLRQARQISIGTKQTTKAVKENRALEVFVADDADEHVTGPLKRLCEENNIPVVRVTTMAELGRACGIEVGSAAAAVIGE